MFISVKWFDGKYPSFNINISKQEGEDEFLSIKGCRLVNGKDGEFVAMPSTKNEQTGKYWNHAWANERFTAHVLKLAQASKPDSQPAKQKPSFDDAGDDIPW